MRRKKTRKLIYGVGTNDADYNPVLKEKIDGKWKTVWKCPFFKKWESMLGRCYSPTLHVQQPAYLGCSVVAEWHLFSTFKAWMETQDWEDKQLDKDLIVQGNKVYGPNTCLLVSRRVNLFITENNASRGEFPIGVSFQKKGKRYRAVCRSVTSKETSLGTFSSPEEAHAAWLAFKLQQAYILASEQTDERIAKALIDRYENYGHIAKDH